jgi:hypothetical protein
MMQLVVSEQGPYLVKPETSLTVKQAPKPIAALRTLTVGKINLIRYHVKHAEVLGPATFFRKGL